MSIFTLRPMTTAKRAQIEMALAYRLGKRPGECIAIGAKICKSEGWANAIWEKRIVPQIGSRQQRRRNAKARLCY